MTRLGRYSEARESILNALSINPEHPSAHLDLGTVTLQIGRSSEARDALQEARRISPVTHHDRKSLAISYGRLMWPFRIIDQLLIRFPAWPPWVRWCLVVGVAAAMLVLALGVKEHDIVKASVFATVLNVLLAPVTFDMAAHAAGKFAYRRDLDIPWQKLLPELLRFAFPVACHAFATWLALTCARSPVLAVFVFTMLPNAEVALILFRQMYYGEPSEAGLAVAGIFVHMFMGILSWLIANSLAALVIFWLISLVFSYTLVVYYRSSTIGSQCTL
jgi:hypothetical protein